ncbi:MAG: hypothetical protein ABSG57_05045 [Candidatus Bathyarchaeia archaeon]
MKDAEDTLQEKELDYLRGFLDCASLLEGEAQAIPHPIPAPKLFDILHSRIEDAYCIAAKRYDEEVKKKLGIFWSEQKEEPAKVEDSKHGN